MINERLQIGYLEVRNRPIVNGTGVLLSGEAAQLPNTIVYTTGNQTISGTKTFKNLKIGPTESSLDQSVDITYHNNSFRLISNTIQDSSIIDSAIVRGPQDPGGNATFWAYRFDANVYNEYGILRLNNANAYADENGRYPNNFQYFDISVLGTGYKEYFYLDSRSGVMRLTNRPTVNGTGVLLSGEIPRLPDTIVYTTGNQNINGEKTFITPTYFTDLVSIETNKWLVSQYFTGNYNWNSFGTEMSCNREGTLMFVCDNTDVSIYNRNNIDENWSFLQKFNMSGYISNNNWSLNDIHFNQNISTLFLGVTLKSGGFVTGENVYIFTGSTQVGWNNLNRVITGYGNSTPANGEMFGGNIKSNDNASILFISATQDNQNGNDAGAVFIYTGSLNQGWKLKQKVVPNIIQNFQYFGAHMDISSDGSVLYISNGGDVINSRLEIYTGSINSTYIQKQVINMPTYPPVPPALQNSDRISSIKCPSDGTRFIITRSKIEVNNNTHVEIYTGNKNIGWGVETSLQTNTYNGFKWSNTKGVINNNSDVIVVAESEAYGSQGALSFFTKNPITNNWSSNQIIIPNTFPFAFPFGNPSLRLGGGLLGSSLIISQDGRFVCAGGPGAPLVQNGLYRGYITTFNLNKQFIYFNSQEINAPLVNISGEIQLYGKKPKYNNSALLVEGEAIRPDSEARLESLKFKNSSNLSLEGVRLLSKDQGSGVASSIVVYSDFIGEIVDFAESGTQFAVRPKVNGSGVLLQGEATVGGAIDAFNGNRNITLNVPGFKDVNAGGNTISGFLNNLFFPFVPATISLNAYPLQELGTTYNQVPFNGSITQNSETQITILQYMLEDTVLNTVTSPSFGNFSTSFTLNLTNNATVRARVSTNNNGSPTIITGSQLISFIAPSWYGVGANGIITGVKNMTKYLNTKANRTFTFNTVNNHFYYAYPNDWGLLSSIIDQNGFNITPSFSNTTGNLLLANNTTNYAYRIYQSINPSTNTNFNITFNF